MENIAYRVVNDGKIIEDGECPISLFVHILVIMYEGYCDHIEFEYNGRNGIYMMTNLK